MEGNNSPSGPNINFDVMEKVDSHIETRQYKTGVKPKGGTF